MSFSHPQLRRFHSRYADFPAARPRVSRAAHAIRGITPISDPDAEGVFLAPRLWFRLRGEVLGMTHISSREAEYATDLQPRWLTMLVGVGQDCGDVPARVRREDLDPRLTVSPGSTADSRRGGVVFPKRSTDAGSKNLHHRR